MSELAHVNRFSMAGELTASIAHEINQPLGSILMNTETLRLILQSPTPDMDEIRDIVADIQRDDKRAGDVIQHLRSLLKKVPFELKLVDLNEIVRETADFLSASAIARQVDMRSAISPASLPIMGDRIQLQQVTLNLIVNAIDAMSNVPVPEREISISTARRGEFAEVAVADAGPGIPPDQLKEVFQPFFSTKPQGMGMGLSIARTIIEAHNGTILAENQVGKGAIFLIRLPLAQ
jgi:signal transduction histidine kinase